MIYKIISDFTNLDQIINYLAKDFDFIFSQNMMFVSPNKSNILLGDMSEKIRDIFGSNCFIQKMTTEMIENESGQIAIWCKQKIIDYEFEVYERNNQEKLNQIMNVLNSIDSQLRKE